MVGEPPVPQYGVPYNNAGGGGGGYNNYNQGGGAHGVNNGVGAPITSYGAPNYDNNQGGHGGHGGGHGHGDEGYGEVSMTTITDPWHEFTNLYFTIRYNHLQFCVSW